ncbi:MAG TPA: hypothetical protein VES64_08515 [Allosphingosinicella sp.]|nr:hypothetical protein [Allosphingosinicella sp.]
MNLVRLLPLAAAAALALTACEARFGNDADPAGNGSARGKAEEGRLSIHAPGFDMKISIPEGIRREAGIDDDSGVIYPNSTLSGMHVEGGRDDTRSDGQVELAFTSADAPDLIARWYQDPARARHFAVATANREGPAFVIAGTTRDRDGDFRVHLTPRQGGGTEARVLLSDRN